MSPPQDPPKMSDAFVRIDPPPGGLQRLRASLDSLGSPSPPPFPWLRIAAPLTAAALLLALAVLWPLLNAPYTRTPQPLTVILVGQAPLPQQPATTTTTLTVDPRWQAALSLPAHLLRPPQDNPLLPVPLGDDAVAFYWAENRLE